MKAAIFHSTVVSIFTIFLGGCAVTDSVETKVYSCSSSVIIEKVDTYLRKTGSDQLNGSFSGKIIGPDGEEIIAAKIYDREKNIGGLSDIDGLFHIRDLQPGAYHFEVQSLGYQTCQLPEITINQGERISIDIMLSEELQPVLLKPIIYFYPEKETEIEIQLDYQGELTTTYPKISGNRWKVNAKPDGTLTDENGRSYYALYWEGNPNNQLQMHDGFVVKAEETITFLEEKLDQLGLSEREANEFIMFWLPKLESSPYNVIHFAQDDYLDLAPLSIQPEPDNVIRVMMVFEAISHPIDFPKQLLPEKPKRDGFTVVEWGGTQVYDLGGI